MTICTPRVMQRNIPVCGTVSRVLLLTLLATAMLSPGRAMSGSRGVPMAATATVRPVMEVQRFDAPPADFSAARAEDVVREQKGLPFRFAIPNKVQITPETMGTWERLDHGMLLWRLRIASPGALSLNLGFTQYQLPTGARLCVYSVSDLSSCLQFDVRDNKEHGKLWTPVVVSDEIVIELTIPEDLKSTCKLELGSVNAGYRGFGEVTADLTFSCLRSVTCPEGIPWRREIPSVGVFSIEGESGTYMGSGFLVNNTAQDGRPLFMTANHCLRDESTAELRDLSSVIVYWNYESPTCEEMSYLQPNPNLWPDWQDGATFCVSAALADYGLVELDDPINPGHKLSFAGWDRSALIPTDTTTAIHHAAGVEKSISIESDPLEFQGGTLMYVGYWETGFTAPGSSGSPLFNHEHHVVGVCSGGPPVLCEYSSVYDPSYSRFSDAWSLLGAGDSYLSDWLDPLGTGVTSLDTFTPFADWFPPQITDLEIQQGGPNWVDLAWTAPSVWGDTGPAASYQVRWSWAPIIDDDTFELGREVLNPPVPAFPGSLQTMRVEGLVYDATLYFAIRCLDEYGNIGPVSNDTTYTTLGPPHIEVAPASLSESLVSGDTSLQQLTVSNVGESPLEFAVALDPLVATDSDEPDGHAFAWVEIASPENLALSGEYAYKAGPFPLSFSFPYYGATVDSLWVTSQGMLYLSHYSDWSCTTLENIPLPSPEAPSNMIAPFWDQLDLGTSGRVYWKDLGDRVVVEWQDVMRVEGGGPYTFEAILWNDGTIDFQYLSMASPLNSATIGLQDWYSMYGVTVACDTDYIHDNLAVRIRQLQWMAVTPTSGTIAGEDAAALNVAFCATGLPDGDYSGLIRILSNDPYAIPSSDTPSSLHVGPPPVLTSPVGGETWLPGTEQVVTWTGSGPVKIELFADVTAQGASLTGPSVVLLDGASGNSATVTMPADIATTRARIQISATMGGTAYYSFSPNRFTIVTPPASGTWSYSAVDELNRGYNQSDMCSNGVSGVEAVYLDLAAGALRHSSSADILQPWAASEIVAEGNMGSWPAIARGSDGNLHVAHYHYPVGEASLYYTVRTGTTWSTIPVVYVGTVQGDCSMVLDAQNVPIIAYDTGMPAGVQLKVIKRQTDGSWAPLGATITSAVLPHHITMRAYGNILWLLYIDLGGARLNLWKYSNGQWAEFFANSAATGSFTDASLALDAQGYPQIAYTVPGAAAGGQKLIFQQWDTSTSNFFAPVTIDDSPGTISSVDLEFGPTYPRIAYVGNGVVKQATAAAGAVQYAWTKAIVDATGNMDSQVSLVVHGNDARWFLYRDLATNSTRSASPAWVDTPPAAVTDLVFTPGRTTGAVSWTAPAANADGTGQASEYDLRYSTGAINAANFANATPWPTGPPRDPGSSECVSVTQLKSCRFYYWAIKTRDSAGNWSAISNCPGAKTSCGIIGREVMCADNFVADQNALTEVLPQAFGLAQNSPNPFSPLTTLAFALPEAAHVRLSIYDLGGRLVRVLVDEVRPAGMHEVQWDATNASGQRVASGVYLCRMEAGEYRETRRVMLIK